MNRVSKLALTAALAVLASCGVFGGDPGQQESSSSADVDFSRAATGTLTSSGFSPSDEVNRARQDYAVDKLAGVRITVQQGTFDPQKFAAQAADGSVADVVQMDRSFVAGYAARKLIMPVNKCFTDLGLTLTSRYYQAAMTDVTYEGKAYAVPEFSPPPVVLFNQRVLRRAGVTKAALNTAKPDPLLAAVKKLDLESKGRPTTLGLDPRSSLLSTWVLGFGGQLMDADGKPTLDHANNVAALDYLKKLYDTQGGYAAVTGLASSLNAARNQNPFVTDRVGAALVEQGYLATLIATVAKIELGAVPFRDLTGQPLAVSQGTGLVIPAKSKNPAAACQWAIATTSDAAWKKAAEARLATNAKVVGTPFAGLFTGSASADRMIKKTFVKPTGNRGYDEAIAATYEAVSHTRSVGASPVGREIKTELTTAGTAAISGRKSAEQALKEAQAAALRAYEAAVR